MGELDSQVINEIENIPEYDGDNESDDSDATESSAESNSYFLSEKTYLQKQKVQNIFQALKCQNPITKRTTLEEAISLSANARLVAQNESPFLIVHANAAFRKFSGLWTQPIVGKPVFDVLSMMNTDITPKKSILLEINLSKFATIYKVGGHRMSSNERKYPHFMLQFQRIRPILAIA